MKVSFNSRLISQQDASIPAVQSALYYGAGCFETMRAESGKLLHFNEHIERLTKGLSWLGADPNEIPSAKLLKDDVILLLSENRLMDSTAKVRIQAFPEESPGYSLDKNPVLSIIITAEPYNPGNQPIKIGTVSTRTIPSASRPADLKLSNMLHYRQAFREAAQNGFDDALLLNSEGYLSETSVANIFWRMGNRVCTPATECDLLPGIMRNSVINLLKNMDGISPEEGTYLPEELEKADEIWITNSLKELQWIKVADGKTYPVDSDFKSDLLSAFSRYKQENLS